MGYFSVLRHWRFALLWTGLTLSSVGDSVTRLALIWLAYHLRASAVDVGLLVTIYSAPIVVGGPLAGIVLDRVGPRAAMVGDNLVRGTVVGLIPLMAHFGWLQPWHLYAVAGVYGFLRMITLAGAPTMTPLIIPSTQLNAANVLETITFSFSDVAGLPLGGMLLSIMNGADVLVVDAASYFFLVVCLLAIGRVSAPEEPRRTGVARIHRDGGLRPAIEFSVRNPFIRNTTLMYMLLNVGRGILDVLVPVLILGSPHGSSRILGFVTGGAAIGELGGSVLAGCVRGDASYPRLIARSLGLNGFPLLILALKVPWTVWAMGLTISSFIQAPLTVWAQTERMRLIPDDLRGRVFALLRTVMQTGPAFGGIAGSLVVGALPPWGVAWLIVVLMSGPGLLAMLVSTILDPESAPA